MSEIISGPSPDEVDTSGELLDKTSLARSDISNYLGQAVIAMEAIQSPEWELLKKDIETAKKIGSDVSLAFSYYMRAVGSIHDLLNCDNKEIRLAVAEFEKNYIDNKEIISVMRMAQHEITFLSSSPDGANYEVVNGLKNAYDLFEETSVMMAEFLEALVAIEQKIL